MRRFALVLIAVALASPACSGSEDEPALPADVDSILTASAEAMGEVDTVLFTIARTGAPVYIDEEETLEFLDADGRFEGPSSADAVVNVTASGFNTRVGAVAIDGEIWLKFPVGDWQPAPASFTFDPATLFDPDLGLRPLLATGLTGTELLGEEDFEGEPTYRLTAEADADRVEIITAGMVSNQNVPVELWIHRNTAVVVAIDFDAESATGTSMWDLRFRDYGSDVEIQPPNLAQ